MPQYAVPENGSADLSDYPSIADFPGLERETVSLDSGGNQLVCQFIPRRTPGLKALREEHGGNVPEALFNQAKRASFFSYP